MDLGALIDIAAYRPAPPEDELVDAAYKVLQRADRTRKENWDPGLAFFLKQISHAF